MFTETRRQPETRLREKRLDLTETKHSNRWTDLK